MTAKNWKTRNKDDGMTAAHPHVEEGTQVKAVRGIQLIEGNCRVVCIRRIAVQMDRSRRRASRAAAGGGDTGTGPTPTSF